MQKCLFKDVNVIEIVNDYIVDFVEITEQSFEVYLDAAHNLSNLPIRTRCDIIRSKAIELFKQRFSDDMRLSFINDVDDTFAITVDNKIVFRFKKLDGRKRANFNNTRRSNNYINQISIDGIYNDKANLILGYRPDQTWTFITNVYIAHPKLNYSYNISEIAEKMKIEQFNMADNVLLQSSDELIKPTIKIKSRGVSKNGTYSSKS